MDGIRAAAEAASVLATPRNVHESFTLHAPLELLARLELLPDVGPDHAPRAVERISVLAAAFAGRGDAVADPGPLDVDTPEAAVEVLAAAIEAADQDAAHAAASWLAGRCPADRVAALLAGPLVFELGAAGHAPILLASYLRFPDADVRPLAGVARQLVAVPGSRAELDWFERGGRPVGAPRDLARTLGALVVDRPPDWGIWALVDAAHRSGVMASLPAIADADLDSGYRALFRVAARSMLDDDPDHAAYGWSHCLTIPLGLYQTRRLHDRTRDAFDMATLLVAGFRLAHGRSVVEPVASPSSAEDGADKSDAVGLGAWQSVIDVAVTHHDAHLVKYVVAARHAARIDPGAGTLYLAAAHRLAAWWRDHPPIDDPLA